MAFNKPGTVSKKIQNINQDQGNKWETDIYFYDSYF